MTLFSSLASLQNCNDLLQKDMYMGCVEPPIYLSTHSSVSVIYFVRFFLMAYLAISVCRTEKILQFSHFVRSVMVILIDVNEQEHFQHVPIEDYL